MAANQVRVVSRCTGNRVQVESGWLTRSQARKFIIGRWGHIPPWAFISAISEIDKLQRRYSY